MVKPYHVNWRTVQNEFFYDSILVNAWLIWTKKGCEQKNLRNCGFTHILNTTALWNECTLWLDLESHVCTGKGWSKAQGYSIEVHVFIHYYLRRLLMATHKYMSYRDQLCHFRRQNCLNWVSGCCFGLPWSDLRHAIHEADPGHDRTSLIPPCPVQTM